MEDVMDRRVKKSKAALKKALLFLLKSKPINKIRIQELCEIADVNRSTFYSNYEDLFHLLSDVYNDVYQEMNHSLGSVWMQKEETNEKEHLTSITDLLRYIKKNHSLFSILINNHDDYHFIIGYHDFIIHQLKLASIQVDSTSFLYHFFGSFTLLQQWIKKGCPGDETLLAKQILSLSKSKINEN